MSADLPWDARQREWLAALGHDVMSLASAGVVAAVAQTHEPKAAPAVPVRQAERMERSLPARAAERAAPAPSPSAAARAPRDSALVRALAQAARRAPDDGEFLRVLPPLASLRGNPAARRALWPRLRALRRGGGP